MVNGGDWVLMQANWDTYVDKPPLFFWLIAFSSFLWQGFTSFSARFPSGLFGTLATMGAGFFYGTRVIFPLVDPYKSARFISQEIVQTIKPGERLAMYGDFGSVGTAPYNFYTGIVPILEIESDMEVLAYFRSEERIFCLFKYQDYERLSKEYPDVPLRLIARRGVGSKDIAFVSNG